MRYSTATSTLIIATACSILVEAKSERNMLELGPDAQECLEKTEEIYDQRDFAPYTSTIYGDERIFNLSRRQPFCQEDEGLVYCDARRLPKTVVDVQGLKEACGSNGGIFDEVDVKLFDKEIIKHFPVCFSSVCDVGFEKTAVVAVWAFNDAYYGVAETRNSPKACDERGFDKFFIKYGKDGKAITGTCSQLAKMVDKPAWMSKHPCDKKWSPLGQPAIASVVCPVTCKTDVCGEDPMTEFFKSEGEKRNKTCGWLSTQIEEKKKKLCSREHNRREGFPSTPSAYSACPVTCEPFM